MIKKTISLILIICMIVGVTSAFTVSASTSGTCGANVSWRITKGVLEINGSGTMLNYSTVNKAPWNDVRSTIVEVVIGEGITNIGDLAFLGCSKITKVTIPSTVTTIGASAFDNCKLLEQIEIPGSITALGNYAFKNSGVVNIVLPSSVTYVGTEAFKDCKDLESIVLSTGMTSIEPRTFSGCSLLSNITLPEGILRVCDGAFEGCTYLKSVSFGSKIQVIYPGAFLGCTKLEEVDYNGSKELWNLIDIQTNNDEIMKTAIKFGEGEGPENAGIIVMLNGKKISFDQPPIILDGRTMVPLRAIFEALGARVEWNNDTKTVIADRGKTYISLTIGSTELKINNIIKILDVPAQIINDRTLVPVRAISEAFGCAVRWEADTQTVVITE